MSRVFKFTLSLYLLSIVQMFSQTAEEHFLRAQEVYPNHELAIKHLEQSEKLEPGKFIYPLSKGKVEFLYSKVSKEKVLSSFQKALKLDPQNNYIKAWLVYVGFHFKENKKFSPLLLEMYENSNDEPQIFYFYLNFLFNKFKSVRLNKETEIYNRLLKAPKTFESIIALYNFYNSKRMISEANREIYKVSTLPRHTLLKGLENYDIFSTKALPFINFTSLDKNFTFNDDSSRKFALKVRIAEEKLIKLHYQHLHIYNTVGATLRFSNAYLTTEDLKAFVTVGLYKKAIEYKKYCQDDNGYHYVGEAYYRMGQYENAIKNLLRVESGYISFLIYSKILLMKCYALSGKYEEALKYIEKASLNDINKEDLKNILSCTLAIYLGDKGKWHKHYNKIDKYNGTHNYLEMMTQVNQMRQIYGNPCADVYTDLSIEKKRKYDNIVDLLYSQAHSCLVRKENKDAIKWLVTANRLIPEDIRDTFEQANFYFKTGDLKKALYRAKQFMTYAPYDIKGLILLGMIHLEKSEYKEAHSIFSKIQNNKIAEYYLLVTSLCENGIDQFKANITEKANVPSDIKTKLFLNLLLQNLTEDQLLEIEKVAFDHESKFLTKFLLGKIKEEQYKNKFKGPIQSISFNFSMACKAMSEGKNDKAIKLFKNCISNYSIDRAEYHMAKACLKELEK